MPSLSGFVPVAPSQEDNPTRQISSIDARLSRTNYFDGRLLRASDLIRDQLYLNERLREVGRVLGQGVVSGFEMTLGAGGALTIQPGLAVAPSGRVVELVIEPASDGTVQPVVISLVDAAQLQSLNPDTVERPGNGLYVVAVRHAQRLDGSAEIFPANLEDDRGFRFNVREDGVQFILTPLTAPLPSTIRLPSTSVLPGPSIFLHQRAALARTLLANQGQPTGLGDDAVALGAVAFYDGQPVWLDEWLVRRIHREPGAANPWQQDLFNHYDALLRDVMEVRTGGFRALSHFELLPSAGRMPVASIEPGNGVQSFFPDHFNVEIAPVREDDLPSLLAEAAALDPIDLTDDVAADIVILAPLKDVDFSRFGRQLEFDPKGFAEREAAYRAAKAAFDAAVDNGASAAEISALKDALESYERYFAAKAGYIDERLPSLDTLTLRSRALADPLPLDTDAIVWRDIQAALEASGELWFMRRPPRTAETGVAAIVLARGYETPAPGTEPGADTEALEEALEEAGEKLTGAERDIATLKAQVEALEDQIASGTGTDLADANRKIAELEGKLAGAEATAALVPGLQARIAELEAALVAAEAEIERLKEALEDGSEADELRVKVNQLQAALASEQAKVARLEAELAGVDIDLDAIVASRRIRDDKAEVAAAKLAEGLRDQPKNKQRIAEALTLIPDGFEAALWPTLLGLAEKDALQSFAIELRDLRGLGSFEQQMQDLVQRLGVSSTTARLWNPSVFPGGRPTRPILDRGILFEPRPSVVRLDAVPDRSVNELIADRDVDDPEVRRSVRAVSAVARRDRAVLTLVNQAVALIPKTYDSVLWSSLERVIEQDTLDTFVDAARRANESGRPVGLAIAAHAQQLKLLAAERNLWIKLDMDRE